MKARLNIGWERLNGGLSLVVLLALALAFFSCIAIGRELTVNLERDGKKASAKGTVDTGATDGDGKNHPTEISREVAKQLGILDANGVPDPNHFQEDPSDPNKIETEDFTLADGSTQKYGVTKPVKITVVDDANNTVDVNIPVTVALDPNSEGSNLLGEDWMRKLRITIKYIGKNKITFNNKEESIKRSEKLESARGPIIVDSQPHVYSPGSRFYGPHASLTGDAFIGLGCPYTILTYSTAIALGLQLEDTIDLNSRPLVLYYLWKVGLIPKVSHDCGIFHLTRLPRLELQAEHGTLICYENIEVLLPPAGGIGQLPVVPSGAIEVPAIDILGFEIRSIKAQFTDGWGYDEMNKLLDFGCTGPMCMGPGMPIPGIEEGQRVSQFVNLYDSGSRGALQGYNGYPDETYPGIDPFESLASSPAVGDDDDYFATEILGCIYLTKGLHIISVNSSDGAIIEIGGIEVGRTEQWKTASNRDFVFEVEADGYYLFRCRALAGDSGAGLELHEIVNGARVLLNDVANGGSPVYLARLAEATQAKLAQRTQPVSPIASPLGVILIGSELFEAAVGHINYVTTDKRDVGQITFLGQFEDTWFTPDAPLADLDEDLDVDFVDFARFAQSWLECTYPEFVTPFVPLPPVVIEP
jgi:hypothetical protein